MNFDEFELLTIKDILKQETLTFVHSYFSKKLPPVFNDYFETLASIHNINTRHGSNLLKIPRHSTNIAAASLKIQGAKLWNKLDSNLKKFPKLKSSSLNLNTPASHMLKSPAK